MTAAAFQAWITSEMKSGSNSKEVPEGDVVRFWDWFRSVSSRLADDPTNAVLLSELDRRVGLLGPFGWEVGPASAKKTWLVISPDGDPELLDVTRYIVGMSPDLPGWEFHASKPPKQWDLQLAFEAKSGEPRRVDASSWTYVLYAYPDRKFDIVLGAPNLAAWDEELRVAVAEHALDCALGEAVRLEHVITIEVTVEPIGKSIGIAKLAKHLQSLLQ